MLFPPHHPSVLQPPLVLGDGHAPHPGPHSPAAPWGPGVRACLPARCGHPAPVGHGPPVREQGRRAGAMGRNGGAMGQPAAPSPLTFSPGRPRSPGSPCGMGRGVSVVPPEQRLSRVRTPNSDIRGEGGTHPCTRGAAGALHTLQERDTLISGAWGKKRVSWVLAQHPLHTRTPGSPAEHHPSCCPSASRTRDPALTLSPGRPGEPTSPRAPFAPSSPGSPGSPCQGRACG